MTTKAKNEKINKQNAWLKYFLTEGAHTFLNKSESARAAGYAYANEDCLRTTGCRLFRKHTDKITEWFDEVGLSENALKNKLLTLLDIKETRLFSYFEPGGEGEKGELKIVEHKIPAIETQRRTLDMAIKVRGMYAAEKREHAFDRTTLDAIFSAMPPEAADRLKAILVKMYGKQ